MIVSMTGFGRAEKSSDERKISVEISSVNNRFLEFQMRLPKNLAELESRIKKLLSSGLSRGKIYFSLTMESGLPEEGRLALDRAKADLYYSLLCELKKRHKLGGEITLDHFIVLPDLITAQIAEVDLEKTWEIVEPVCQMALSSLNDMRRAEGQSLKADFEKRLGLIEALVSQIKGRFQDNYRVYYEKLKKRISELLAETPLDEQRLATEVALLADRLDITEETIRLEVHLESFRDALGRDEAIGKRLTFILQELHRETNTIGAKSADSGISSLVIGIKEEIEKLREQAQNIE